MTKSLRQQSVKMATKPQELQFCQLVMLSHAFQLKLLDVLFLLCPSQYTLNSDILHTVPHFSLILVQTSQTFPGFPDGKAP